MRLFKTKSDQIDKGFNGDCQLWLPRRRTIFLRGRRGGKRLLQLARGSGDGDDDDGDDDGNGDKNMIEWWEWSPLLTMHCNWCISLHFASRDDDNDGDDDDGDDDGGDDGGDGDN